MAELKERFASGESFAEFLERPKKYGEFWASLYKRAQVPPEFLERAKKIERKWHFLVLSEDWCGDSINTLPLVAKLLDSMPHAEMRIISRDKNLDLMDQHLTGTSRSIPVIMLLDENYVERGWWGPRPKQLQDWVVGTGLALPKDDRYREVRTWYARDHGHAVLSELFDLLENDGRHPEAV